MKLEQSQCPACSSSDVFISSNESLAFCICNMCEMSWFEHLGLSAPRSVA
jgi:formate dehydrogenase maturation protein FdhE